MKNNKGNPYWFIIACLMVNTIFLIVNGTIDYYFFDYNNLNYSAFSFLQDERIFYWASSTIIVLAVGFFGARIIKKQLISEESIRESERRYETLYNESSDARMLLGENGFINCNKMALELFGVDSKKTFCKKHILDLSPQNQPSGESSIDEDVLKQIRKAHEEGYSKFEWLYKRACGEVFYADVLLSTINFEGRKILQVTIRDITDRKKLMAERKRAENEVKRSEEKYRRIVEGIEEGYFETNLKGNFTFTNNSLCLMLGYSMIEINGLNYRRYTDTENARKVYRMFNQVFVSGKSTKYFDWKLIRKDGSVIIVEASVSLKQDDEGKASGFYGIIRDVTHRKELEAERENMAKLEMVGLLAAGIAHDLNNLLAVILGNTELCLASVGLTNDQERHLEIALNATKKASELSYRYLTFSKGTISSLKLSNISEVISGVMFLSSKGDTVRCLLEAEENLWAKIDPIQLTQVIQNLVINAKQAIQGVGTISIQARKVEKIEKAESGALIHISISDTGTGISAENIKNIFKPYFSTKKVSDNQPRGLGLASVKSIIEKHNGQISVKSVPDVEKGTVFDIFLPAVCEIPNFQEEKNLRLKSQTKLKVLIMDDEEQILTLIRLKLERLGHQAETCMSSNEAITRYKEALEKQQPFDLVILDASISGGLGGSETLKILKNINPDIISIISTGYANEMPEGFSAALPKPYSIEDLEKILKMLFG